MPVGAAVRNVSSISAGRAVAAYAACSRLLLFDHRGELCLALLTCRWGMCAILVPVSGFWLVLPQAVMMLVVARRGATAKAGKPTWTEQWAGSR